MGHLDTKCWEILQGHIEVFPSTLGVVARERAAPLIVTSHSRAPGEIRGRLDYIPPFAEFVVALRLIAEIVNQLKDRIVDELLQQHGFVDARIARPFEVPRPDQPVPTAEA